ncbi:beta/gamma crystallin domain-containing protein 2 isoform X2 [Rhineura floridana]|nr:beta/gamma crystallin domain-containing protein 2 isoform X2 [Rhineura floridana]XP_061453270.1 beta/gamma crystallin domain-containing protein 2 isoform X2 [Rhineura floridana]
MEKVISNSRSSQSRSEGSAVSTSFRWKKSAPDLLKEEPKPPLGKVLAMTQMIERGGARTRTRTRGNSPSRVSMLLEAWEKGLVGTDAAGPSSSADIRHSHSSLPTRRVLSSKDAPRPLFPENTGLSLSPASIRRSLSPSDRQRSVFLAETRQSHSPAHTKRSLSPAETRHCFSPAETRHCFSPAETRRSRSPAETRCSFSPVETRRSFSPAETRRSFSPAEARRSRSPAETRCSFSPAETRRSRSPAETRRSFSPAETRHSFSPAETRRSRSLGETRRSFSPAETRRSRSPADIKRSPSPASTWHSFSTAEIRHSFSPVETRRCHSLAKNSPPADSRHSFSAVEMRRPHSPASNKPPCFQADPQCSSFSTGSQHSSSSIESCLSSFSADDHGSPSPVNIQHSSSLPVDKCPYSVADIRRLYCSADTGCPSSPTNTKHPISSAEPRRPSSPADTKHPSSSAEPRHPFPFPENRLSSSPADTRHSSPPTDSRSFSPTSDERCSHSLSPQKGFTAHGPVFAQVYSPVSKSKSLGGTQMPDADSTAVAGSQEEHSCSDATNTPLATELQTASHISSPDGSQKDNPPPVPISTRAIESQRESHMSNGAVSDTVAGSLRESDQPIAIILRSQTENYQSQSVSPSLFCGSPEGNCTPSATSVNPSSEPCVLSPFPRAVSSSTVAKSQTEWYVPKSDSRAVFKSGRQVIIPQAGTTTVYRAGQGISMSSSEAEGPSNAQQGRSLVLNSGSNLPPEENCQSQSDLPDGESPKGSPASLPDGACNCSTAGSEQESCMTQSRNASASDAQRQRCKRLPNPALTSNGDATTLWERVSPFSTSKKGCNPHTVPLFQRHSNLFTASRSERKQSIPDLGGPIANRSEQETAGETRVFGTSTGSTETAPSDQTATELSEKQSNPIKDAPVLTLESTIPLTEMNSSPELLSQKTGSSSRMAEEEPEEVVDMELFVDTLRNMEPPELRKPLKLLPRPLLPSTFTKHTPLPPIHEDHISPKSKLPLPAAQGELFAFTEEGTAQGAKDAQEEDAGLAEAEVEEIENPYPSKEERLQENSQTRESFPWENKTFKTEEEIGSFLGKLQQGPVVPTAQIIAPEAIANYSNLIRANILKGLSLLSGFSEKQAVENKPYSRLDNSLLYSKFISPEKSQLKASEKRKEEGCSHTLLFSAVQKVNRECQTSPNGLEMKTFEHLSSELLRSGLHADPVSWVPGANSNSSRVPLLSREADSLPQSETQQEEKKLSEKVNVRPGKIVLYFESGFGGQKREIWGDIIDATSWELSHTISIRVVRGGWVIYEKPRFQGRKCVLAEGDVEISNPWRTSHKEGAAVENGPFHIGSLKRVVQDYKIPEISLFTEENGEGIKWKFTDSSEDTQIHSLPLKAASIIVHSGLWLVYSKPFFDDDPYVLEPGGYPTLQAWGAKDPTICSMHPIKMGCPVVEKPGEPKALIYEQPHFQGHSWEVSRDIYNLKKPENNQDSKMSTAGSLKIAGGCWIGYEKEGFRGHQYLLEEGEYYDWTQWGGYNEDLVSLRLIRTDFLDPALVLFEAMDFEEGPSVELSEALPDVELACYGTTTQSIHVLSGVWVAYEGKNYSGEQYILEKGVYRSCEDWGASNCQISSVQPILQVGEHSLHFVSQIQLFSDPDFLGNSVSFKEDQASLPENFIPRSCRVNGGSWILFDCPQFDGDQHILSEGEYPTLTSMGCLFTTAIRSLKKVPIFFSEPSIFLHGLECFEGKEIELNSEVRSLQAEGFNNHVLSVRVKGGIWVLCEHSDFRGRQWLLDCIEITNWLTYSGLQHVGSLYPIRQRRIYFRLKNEELKSFLSVPDDAEDMKAGRVLVSELNDKSSSIWYYEEGLMKNQVAPNMSLQVIGPAGKGSKVVLWSESRMPCQTWRVDSLGRICSQMFEHKVLDVKGGRTYDRDHAILWDSSEARPTQIWAVQVL